MKQATILLLNLHPSNRLSEELRGILEPTIDVATYALATDPEASTSGSIADLATTISEGKYDLIFWISSQHLPTPDSLVQTARTAIGEVPFIAVVDGSEPSKMFELLRLGAADYITQPLKAVEILPRVWRLLEKRQQADRAPHSLKEKLGLKQLIGKSPAFLSELEKIPLVAKTDVGILISGETGTGKELYARAIHHLSLRASKPFIPVNCGAIPADLVENELFGHERGAFSGANRSERGLLQDAEGGTIFLDEIDCLPLLAQSKLLRFLQEKEFRPLGSTKMRKADVRVLAASNVDFEAAVASDKLRKDLYYRLNVVRLTLPPLRDRGEDIPLLVQHFLVKYANEFDKKTPSLSAGTVQMLMLYDWPGNVRELEHVIERAVLLCKDGLISNAGIDLPEPAQTRLPETFQRAKANVIDRFEKAYIQGLLIAYQGNITRAAEAACKNRRAFWQLIRKHRIKAQTFRQCPS